MRAAIIERSTHGGRPVLCNTPLLPQIVDHSTETSVSLINDVKAEFPPHLVTLKSVQWAQPHVKHRWGWKRRGVWAAGVEMFWQAAGCSVLQGCGRRGPLCCCPYSIGCKLPAGSCLGRGPMLLMQSAAAKRISSQTHLLPNPSAAAGSC